MQTYIDNWELFALMAGAIGLYLMSVNHSIRGLWDRTSTARVVRRAWRVVRGKPVVVVPYGKRRGDKPLFKQRVFVYHDR